MGSGNEIMDYMSKKIKKFMEIKVQEDNELFFIMVLALLEVFNEEKGQYILLNILMLKRSGKFLSGTHSDVGVSFVWKAISYYLWREGLLHNTNGVTINEQVGIFMFMISHNTSNERLQKAFQQSRETIHIDT